MQTESSDHPIKDKLQHSFESGKESVASCCDTIRRESSQLCDNASDGIRRNPIASVVGAAFAGAAICYLLLESRHEPSFRERYVSTPLSNAGHNVNDSLHSLFGSLKFW
ncbi:MAG: hypothetical protein ABJQ29_13170 [Luteolibacter sp.]